MVTTARQTGFAKDAWSSYLAGRGEAIEVLERRP